MESYDLLWMLAFVMACACPPKSEEELSAREFGRTKHPFGPYAEERQSFQLREGVGLVSLLVSATAPSSDDPPAVTGRTGTP